MMRRFFLVICAALICASTATAENAPDPRLDAAASFVAGHPVTVYCEMSWATWLASEPESVTGFTNPPDTVVHVNPRICLTLTMLLHGDDAGAMYAADALLTLAHESVHQRGVTDEGVTDCTALPLVTDLATKFFDVPSTVPEEVAAPKKITVRFGKRTQRVTVTYVKTINVPNPWLTQLGADALRWHRAKPPAYQGGC